MIHRTRLLGALAGLALLVGVAPAQINDGDIVYSGISLTGQQGMLWRFDPMTQSVTTITSQFTANNHLYQVDMAADNTQLLVSQTRDTLLFSDLYHVQPNGSAVTLAQNVPEWITGMDLDGDDNWIVTTDIGGIFQVNRVSGQVTTLVPAPATDDYEGIAIVREGGVKYAVANLFATAPAPAVYNMDRTGLLGTIVPAGPNLIDIYDINYAATTGDLFASDFTVGVSRVTLGGTVSSLVPFDDAEGVRILPDNTMYIIGNATVASVLENTIQRWDLTTNTAVSTWQLPQTPLSAWFTYGLAVYGSRVLTCTGTPMPGGSVPVAVKSHRAAAANANYQLAISFGRRPGVTLPNGERLMLNVTDPLFLLSANNALPGITVGFSGTLDAFGRGAGTVNIPATLPANLGITIFVGGVIYNASGVVQVTNVHWFEI